MSPTESNKNAHLMRLSGIVATSHQFRQYTTELHNVLPQNVLLGTTYFLAIREIPRNKLTWAETSQDGFHWWYLKGHGETGQTCIHLGSPRWASEKCFRLYVRKDMNFSWNPLIYKLHTSTRSQLSSDVNRRNVKCKPEPCSPVVRDLPSLNLLGNGTTNWIIFTRQQ